MYTLINYLSPVIVACDGDRELQVHVNNIVVTMLKVKLCI